MPLVTLFGNLTIEKGARSIVHPKKGAADWSRNPLIITGASGLGKSALIANWVKERLQDENSDVNIIYHFTGNGGSESDSETVVTTLINEIREVYGFVQDNEIEYENKAEELDCLIQQVDDEGTKPLIIVLDAINQIEDVDDAKELEWLPYPGEKVKFLFSTLEADRTMAVLRDRECEVFTLQPLDVERRTQLVVSYLGQFSKKLTDEQVRRIVTDTQCENTLVLRTVMEELVNFGVFELLDQKIDYYLHAESVEAFYQSFLQSFESEFGEEFIRHILSLISVSRNGMTEDEILDILNAGAEKDQPKVPQLQWSQFYCAFSAHVNTKGGRINFSHYYISSAVKTRYEEEGNKQSCREEIMAYFEKDYSPRAIHEFVYQAIALKETERLQQYVCQREVAEYYLNQEDKNEFKKIWSLLLEEENPIELNWEETEEAYKIILDYINFIQTFEEKSNRYVYPLLEQCLEISRKNNWVKVQLEAYLYFISYYHFEDADSNIDKIESITTDYQQVVFDNYGNTSKEGAHRIVKLGFWLRNMRQLTNEEAELAIREFQVAEKLLGNWEISHELLECYKVLGELTVQYSDETDEPDYYQLWVTGVKQLYPYGSEEHKECIRYIDNKSQELSLYRLYKETEEMESAFDITDLSKHIVKKRKELVLEIGESVPMLEDYAFENDTMLTEIKMIPNSVKKIGKGVFSGCTSLISVGQISNYVTIIGNEAFRGCTSLSHIEIPNSVTEIRRRTFEGCTSLTHIDIPNSITEIRSDAFRGCKCLTSITLPDSIKRIGKSAFSGCIGLTSIEIPSSVTIICDSAFEGCARLKSVIIPQSVGEIGNKAFAGCYRINELTIPDSADIAKDAFEESCGFQIPYTINDDKMEEIEDAIWDSENETEESAFRVFAGMVDVVIPDSFKEIDDYAFEGCTDLVSIVIPHSVTKIGEYAFNGCTSLRHIDIPNSVREIGEGAFYGCTSLVHVEIPDSVIKINSKTFEGCTDLTTVIIPHSVVKIEDFAFFDCTSLTQIEIPNSVQVIDRGAFANCASLTHVEMSFSVNVIGDSAFHNCTNLIGICVPGSVKIVGCCAFKNCCSLSYLQMDSVETLYESVFEGCVNLHLVVSSSLYQVQHDALSGIKAITLKFTDSSRLDLVSGIIDSPWEVSLYIPKGTEEIYRQHPYFKQFREIIEIENELVLSQAELLAEAEGLWHSQRFDDAYESAIKAYQKCIHDLGKDSMETLYYLYMVCFMSRNLGKFEEALSIANEVIDASKRNNYPPLSYVPTLRCAAKTCIELQDIPRAMKYLEEALNIQKQYLEVDDPDFERTIAIIEQIQ